MSQNILDLKKELLQHKIQALEKEIEIEKRILEETKRLKWKFITDKSSLGTPRIIEHPAESNSKKKYEWQFRHPMNPRAQVRNTTFKTLKNTLQEWKPDNTTHFKDNIEKIEFESTEYEKQFLKKCLTQKENIDDFHIIQVFRLTYEKEQHPNLKNENIGYKICIFNEKEQLFYLRSIFHKEWITMSNYLKILKSPSQIENWYVDHSSLMVRTPFWINLQKWIQDF